MVDRPSEWSVAGHARPRNGGSARGYHAARGYRIASPARRVDVHQVLYLPSDVRRHGGRNGAQARPRISSVAEHVLSF